MTTPAETVRAAEHTPGPWRVDPATGYVCTDVQNIAEIIPDTVSDAEIAANRALISAAPELLAALEAQSAPAAHFGQCHQCGADLRGNVWHCSEYGRLLVKARDMARDAIAKAKGGA